MIRRPPGSTRTDALVPYSTLFRSPVCQVLMMRFDGDLVELLLAVSEGRLAGQGPAQLAERASLTVVLAANGYPGTPEQGGGSAGIDVGKARVRRVGKGVVSTARARVAPVTVHKNI